MALSALFHPVTVPLASGHKAPQTSVSSLGMLFQCPVKPYLPFSSIPQGQGRDLGLGQMVHSSFLGPCCCQPSFQPALVQQEGGTHQGDMSVTLSVLQLLLFPPASLG